MTPTKIHLTFRTDASGDVLIDKASPEPFVGSAEFVRAQGWRPIESAPKMRGILLWANTSTTDFPNWKMGTGYFSDGHNSWIWEGEIVRDWAHPPTHWMPLPPSPSEKGVG